MTTEEKLQHFLDTCMEDARVRSGRMLDEYMTALEKTFEEHKADTRRREKLQLQQETEKAERRVMSSISGKPASWQRNISAISVWKFIRSTVMNIVTCMNVVQIM